MHDVSTPSIKFFEETNNTGYTIEIAILVTLICIALLITLCKYKTQIISYCQQKKEQKSHTLPYINHKIYKPRQSYEMQTILNSTYYFEPFSLPVYRPTVESLSLSSLSSSTSVYQEIN